MRRLRWPQKIGQCVKVVGADMIYISSFGKARARADVFAAFQSGTIKIERIGSYDISTGIYGGIKILIYQADTKMINGDNIVEGVTWSTTVYRMRKGDWLMISQHQSPVEEE
jgi:hypothetical protein